MSATNQQVQRFVDERFRPFAERVRELYLLAKDHRAAIDDVYAACAQQSPTWTDSRVDGPPHLLVPQDVLSWNAFMANVIMAIEATADGNTLNQISGNWATVLKACVRSPV